MYNIEDLVVCNRVSRRIFDLWVDLSTAFVNIRSVTIATRQRILAIKFSIVRPLSAMNAVWIIGLCLRVRNARPRSAPSHSHFI